MLYPHASGDFLRVYYRADLLPDHNLSFLIISLGLLIRISFLVPCTGCGCFSVGKKKDKESNPLVHVENFWAHSTPCSIV